MKQPVFAISCLLFALALFFCPQASEAQVTQKPVSGLNTLWAFGKERGGPEQSRVVGLVGFFGQEQPSQWLVLVSDANYPGTYREYVSRQARTINMRTFQAQPGQDLPSIPLPLPRLKIDSQQAFRICEATALRAGIGFDSLHYQLRCRDLRNEPVWVVNMLDRNRSMVGVIYLSAEDGTVFRTVWNQPGNTGRSLTQNQTAPSSSNQGGLKGAVQRIFGNDPPQQAPQQPAITGPARQQPAAAPQGYGYQQPQTGVPAPPAMRR